MSETKLGEPNIQCSRCHGALSEHRIFNHGLEHDERDCFLSGEDLRQQIYAWADYALGNDDRARERNYSLRTGAPV
jgi:hypothetical protein